MILMMNMNLNMKKDIWIWVHHQQQEEVLNFIEFLQFKSQKHHISTKGKSQQKSPEELGWPPGFFEQTYGSCQDDPIVIDDEDNFAQREEAA